MSQQDIKKLQERVYYVSARSDTTVLVAMDVEIRDGNLIRWFDTVKERMMEIKEIVNDNPKHFSFKRDSGDKEGDFYDFIPMTLEIYNTKVKKRLLSPKDITNEEEMFKEFETTRSNAW
mgnify:CR=1 FL=1